LGMIHPRAGADSLCGSLRETMLQMYGRNDFTRLSRPIGSPLGPLRRLRPLGPPRSTGLASVFASTLATLGFAATALTPLPSWAQEEERRTDVVQANEAISFRVNICLATSEEGGVDPECASMQKQLHVQFRTLRLQHTEEVSRSMGETTELLLPVGPPLRFRPTEMVDSLLHLHLEMPGVVDTRAQLRSGRSIIMAGIPYRGGDLIIELLPSFAAPPPRSRMAEKPRAPRPSSPIVRRVGARRSGGGR